MIARLPCALALVLATTCVGPRGMASEEFVGPFQSWRDLRRDYGAAGDGATDDTAALQRGLDDLVKHQEACVLYIPPGTYRLTDTVRTVRQAHTDCQGVSITGADPARAVLRWDGADGGTMVEWDAWYSRISRLTLDGRSRAGVGLRYGPAFSTYNETSDLVFRDLDSGLVFGGPDTAGQAENEVLRCRFERCGTGVQTVNWNSMDIWVWYCRFEDCDHGIHNVMGNWHAWHNLFLRSRTSDLSIANLMVFSVVNNTSLGSRCFVDFRSGHTWGSPTSITGNRILDPTGEWAVLLDNSGPYLVADNVFRLADETRGVRMTWGDQTLVGNTYTRADAVEERGRFRRLDEQVVAAADIADELPDLPPTPPRRERRVFEVPKDADAAAIQAAIDDAARLAGQRPVVHLPMGVYQVAETIVIPAACDVQLVGDGAGETASRLNWLGAEGGTVLRLEGPSHATLRDFYIHAPTGRGIVVERADQQGGRIFADQLNASMPTGDEPPSAAAVQANGLHQSDVLLRALQGSGNSGAWVKVMGEPEAAAPNVQTAIYTGATGSAISQYEVRDGGRLVVRGVYHERSTGSLTGLHLTDSGTLSIDATRFSYETSATAPTVAVDGFRGMLTLATSLLMPVGTDETCRLEMRGDGSAATVLALNDLFWVVKPGTSAETVWRNQAEPPARGGLLGCNINTPNKDAAPEGFESLANIGDHPDPARAASGSGPLADRGTVDDATIRRHLQPVRQAHLWWPGDSPAADGATDVRIHRVMVSGGLAGAVEFRGDRLEQEGR